MNTHILIPEAHSYGIAILVIFGLCSFSLALHINARGLAGKRINFWVIHNGVMLFIVVWGLLLFDATRIIGTSPLAWIISVPVGFIVGWVARWCDRSIIRHLARRQFVQGNSSIASRHPGNRRTQNDWNMSVRSNHIPIATQLTKRRIISLHKGQRSFRPSQEYQQFGLWSILITAILEELIYRGFLARICFLLPDSFLIGIALVGVCLAFSLAHIQFGWQHVLAKLPLSVLAMAVIIGLGTVLPAVVAHVAFNTWVWKDKSSQPVFLGQYERSQSLIP